MKWWTHVKLTIQMAVMIALFGHFSLSAATATTERAAFEAWTEASSHRHYGSMGLRVLQDFERGLEPLGEPHRGFYGDLTAELLGNNEFIDSAYLNEATPPLKKDLIFNMASHGLDVVGYSMGVYLFKQQISTMEDCSTCFATEGINSSTGDCSKCYGDVISPKFNTLGLTASTLLLVKSGILLLNDIREAWSGRGRARFEPTESQTEREAQKTALYLTLKKHEEITTSRDRGSLVRDYGNWAVTILRDHYVAGSRLALVNKIRDYIMELP